MPTLSNQPPRLSNPQNIPPIFGYNIHMPDSKSLLEQQFLEMRWRMLSLAADFDRIQRGVNGQQTLATDPRIARLRKGVELLLSTAPNRAEQFQMIFSDMTPPPK